MKVDDIEIIKEILDRNFDENKKIYLVYTEFNEEETRNLDQNSDLTKIFESNEAMEMAEIYNIYEINR